MISPRFYLSFILLANLTFAQTPTWTWQYPYPQGNWLYGVHSFSGTSMIAVGKLATILTTTNSGATWDIRHRVNGLSDDFRSVYFLNSLTGWIGADSGKVLRTTDGGATWQTTNTLAGTMIYSLFFLNASTGYAGSYNKLIKTTDGGLTWASNPNIVVYGIYFFDSNTGIIAGHGNLNGHPGNGVARRTTDGGANWTTYNSLTQYAGAYMSVQFTDNQTGWIGGGVSNQTKLFKSTDGGLNFAPVGTDTCLSIRDMYFQNGMIGWISSVNGIFKTTNGGQNWQAVYSPPNMTSPVFGTGFSMNFYNNTFCYAVQNANVLRSSDAGISWIYLSRTDAGNSDHHKIQFVNPNYGWTNGFTTLYRTVDGGLNWSTIEVPGTRDIHESYFTDQNTGWLVAASTGSDRFFKTTNGGLNWTAMSNGLTADFHVQFINSSTGFVTGTTATDFASARTNNGGQTWMVSPIMSSPSYWGTDLAFTDVNTGYVNVNGRLYKTVNGGNNWSQLTLPFNPQVGLGPIFFLNASAGYLAYRPDIFTPIELYKTSNGGNNWAPMGISSFNKQGINDIHFLNENVGLAVLQDDAVNYESLIAKTTNGGQTWTSFYTGSFAGISDIFFLTPDQAWAAGYNNVILKSTNLGATFVNNQNNEIPHEYGLMQNYPNPFNPVTRINFDIPVRSHVRLTVVNILGEAVDVLSDNLLNAGKYFVEWNAAGLPSGVYFCTLSAESFSQTKKMVLVK